MKTLILLAGGSSNRMQGAVDDKTLALLKDGQSVIARAAQSFKASGLFETTIVIYRDDPQREALQKSLHPLKLNIKFVQGGATRNDSVLAGLEAVPQNTEFVFIHDGARPLIQTDAILRLFKAVQTDKAAVLAHPLNDTIKRIPTAGQLKTQPLEDLERDRLWAMETPQAFAFPQILQAYTQVRKAGLTVTDDTAAAAHIGLHATLVHNTSPNPKITTPEDLAFLQWYLDQA